jgi:ZIP family zinc transporter
LNVLVQAALLGTLASLPLIVGAVLAMKYQLPSRTVGIVAAFGAGALISAVSFDLVLEASAEGRPWILAIGLAAGALAYWFGNGVLRRRGAGSGGSSSRGLALLLGAVLDGIPESFILGLTVASGAGVSLPFLVAVAVSNFPEGMSSAAALKGDPDFPPRKLLRMWAIVIAVCACFAGLGGWLGADAPPGVSVIAQAFAAGGLLTMVTDDMIPEADEKAGPVAGLALVLGFAVAFALHQLG